MYSCHSRRQPVAVAAPAAHATTRFSSSWQSTASGCRTRTRALVYGGITFGARVERGIAGRPTAFYARLPAGQPGPRVAILAEL